MVLTVAFIGFGADRVYQAIMRRALRWQAGDLDPSPRASSARLACCSRDVGDHRAAGRLGIVRAQRQGDDVRSAAAEPRGRADVERRGSGELLLNTALTLYRALTGFVIAVVAGVALGVLVARSAIGRWFSIPSYRSASNAEDRVSADHHPLAGVYDLSKIDGCLRRYIPGGDGDPHGIQGVEKELIWSARAWAPTTGRRCGRSSAGGDVADPHGDPGRAAHRLIVEIVCEMTMGGYGLAGPC